MRIFSLEHAQRLTEGKDPETEVVAGVENLAVNLYIRQLVHVSTRPEIDSLPIALDVIGA